MTLYLDDTLTPDELTDAAAEQRYASRAMSDSARRYKTRQLTARVTGASAYPDYMAACAKGLAYHDHIATAAMSQDKAMRTYAGNVIVTAYRKASEAGLA